MRNNLLICRYSAFDLAGCELLSVSPSATPFSLLHKKDYEIDEEKIVIELYEEKEDEDGNVGHTGMIANNLLGTGKGDRNGMLERSILHFKLTYPLWKP